MKHLTRIECVIPHVMDWLAALISALFTVAMTGALTFLVGPEHRTGAAGGLMFFANAAAGAYVGIRITRQIVRDQVHMELAEGGK
jgi:hypothetical protein